MWPFVAGIMWLTPGLVDGGLQAAAVIAWLVHTKIVYTDVTVDTSQNLPPTMVSPFIWSITAPACRTLLLHSCCRTTGTLPY